MIAGQDSPPEGTRATPPPIGAAPSPGRPPGPGRHRHGRGWLTILAGLPVLVAGVALTWGVGPASPGRASTRIQANSGARVRPPTIATIESRTDPAIVDVAASLGSNGSEVVGTGIVLTSNGRVLTNNHVIAGASSIRATDIGNGKHYTATLVGSDRSADVAVLQLEGASGLDTANIGDSSKVTRAERVVALGNAGGAGGRPKAAAGAVTALDRSVIAADAATGSRQLLSHLIESNADLQAGDSGGPLVDAGGQVIGMDSAVSGISRTPGGSARILCYSIPINRAMRLAQQMEAGHSPTTVHLPATPAS